MLLSGEFMKARSDLQTGHKRVASEPDKMAYGN